MHPKTILHRSLSLVAAGFVYAIPVPGTINMVDTSQPMLSLQNFIALSGEARAHIYCCFN